MREMKDSGVEWIGEIPKDWKLSKTKYFYDCYDGKRVPIDAAQRKSGVYPYWGAGSITDYVDDYLFDEELVLVGEDGAPFFDYTRPVSFLINEKVWVNNHIHVLKVHNDTDSAFMVYFFNTVDYGSYINGSILNKLTQGNMNNIAFVVPPYEEQVRIVNYLDSKCAKIDSIIEKQQAIIEKLKEYKLSVINEAVTHGINSEVEMKDSGYKWIGDIPKHWNMVYAKQLFTQRKDRAYEEDEQLTSSQKYGIIFQKEFMEIEGRQVMQVLKGEEILKHVEKGDFVISMRSFQGGLEYSEVSGKISSAYVMLIPNKAKVYDRYYKWLFKSKRYISALQGTSNLIRDGQALRFSNFIQVYLPNFNMDEQKQIADYLDKICPKLDAEVEKREKLLEKMNEYKKALIYEVVTGKKEV